MTQHTQKMAIKCIALLLPVFFMWKLLAPYTILPVVTSVTHQVITTLFTSIQPQVIKMPDKETWNIDTRLYKSSKNHPHNTYKPKLTINGSTSIRLGALINLTLNFPLFWLLMLVAMNKQHWKRCLYNIAKGSLIILCSTCFYISVKACYVIIKALQSSDLLRVYHAPYILIPPTPPDWLLVVLKPLLDSMGYLSTMVIPVALVCYYCYPMFFGRHEHTD